MTIEQYQEFIEFTQNLYANRDAYSRGKIIEDIREKVTELQQSYITEVEQVNPEVCGHDVIVSNVCVNCYMLIPKAN